MQGRAGAAALDSRLESVGSPRVMAALMGSAPCQELGWVGFSMDVTEHGMGTIPIPWSAGRDRRQASGIGTGPVFCATGKGSVGCDGMQHAMRRQRAFATRPCASRPLLQDEAGGPWDRPDCSLRRYSSRGYKQAQERRRQMHPPPPPPGRRPKTALCPLRRAELRGALALPPTQIHRQFRRCTVGQGSGDVSRLLSPSRWANQSRQGERSAATEICQPVSSTSEAGDRHFTTTSRRECPENQSFSICRAGLAGWLAVMPYEKPSLAATQRPTVRWWVGFPPAFGGPSTDPHVQSMYGHPPHGLAVTSPWLLDHAISLWLRALAESSKWRCDCLDLRFAYMG